MNLLLTEKLERAGLDRYAAGMHARDVVAIAHGCDERPLPHADADMMQLHLDEISRNVAEGVHAVLLLDRAGWHTTSKLDVPNNITPIFLPSRAP